MKQDLTQGSITGTMLRFAGPMILGNLLQQGYNIADTLIVGRFAGVEALAAVGASYSLMTFLTSVIIGLCMGSGAVFSVCMGRNDRSGLRRTTAASLLFIAAITLAIHAAVLSRTDALLELLRVPPEVFAPMAEYVNIVLGGLFFVFLYNFFAFLLRAAGDSVTPLCVLGASALLNIGLDIVLVAVLGQGAAGAARATLIAQILAGTGIAAYVWFREKELCPRWADITGTDLRTMARVGRHSMAACLQQSVMNFGILMIQGLVNSFGVTVMAAFAAVVKIDSVAYMPAQEFGNAFSLFISGNHGGGKTRRIREGIRQAMRISTVFCLAVSAAILVWAPSLMRLFVDRAEIVATGVEYLRIEGCFYFAIGVLFLLYGFYRGVERPEMSLLLTVISLGTRVALAYLLSALPSVGVRGIWWAIPIGWILADLTGLACSSVLRSAWSAPRQKEA